jgi:hypothetical protein
LATGANASAVLSRAKNTTTIDDHIPCWVCASLKSFEGDQGVLFVRKILQGWNRP